MESRPQRAGTNGEIAARPTPSDHSERILVAMRPQVGTRYRRAAGWEWCVHGHADKATALRRATWVDLLQHEREAAVPVRTTCQHGERQRTAAPGFVRHIV